MGMLCQRTDRTQIPDSSNVMAEKEVISRFLTVLPLKLLFDNEVLVGRIFNPLLYSRGIRLVEVRRKTDNFMCEIPCLLAGLYFWPMVVGQLVVVPGLHLPRPDLSLIS